MRNKQEAQQLMLNKVREVLLEVVELFFIPHFLELGMDATGEWRNNVEVRDNEIWGRHYTRQLEYGRRPGKFVPIQPLKRWAMAKFGISPEEATSVAYAVSNKIKNEGTRYYKQGGTDLMEVLRSERVTRYINEQLRIFARQQVELYVSQEILSVFKRR